MKTVEIFKTNVQNNKYAAKLMSQLMGLYPVYRINFDLEDEEIFSGSKRINLKLKQVI